MKVVILCGGQGTRIRDVSEVLPKPMLPIGDRPILWHIMKTFAAYGHKDFILCLGYKGWTIKEFFLNYYAKTSDVSLTLGDKESIAFHHPGDEADWQVTMVDTGEASQTGKRIACIASYLDEQEPFCVTYGDGLADIDIRALLKAHQEHGLPATITGVQPSGRFGEIELNGNVIREFNEKPNVSSGMINGGYMVFERSALDKYFDPLANQSLEQDILPVMVADRQVGAYQHHGAWQCIDTPREYHLLNQLWSEKRAFWAR